MKKVIEVSFPGGKKVDAKVDNFVIKTDQSLKNGGQGSEPPPFYLFLSSITACAGIYALNFCDSREIQSTGMSLTMNCEFDPEQKRYTKMALELKLPPGFPEKYKDSIIRAMELCGVKKHIMNPPEFEVSAK